MTDPTTERLLTRTASTSNGGRPVRKDEIELPDRGLYIESWLPERRSRRKPLLFVHGELAGSWVWERLLHHFAARGWEGHALNLRNHFWSSSADPTTLSFDTYTEDVVAALERLGPGTVAIGHGMGALLSLKALERTPASAYVLIAPLLPGPLRGPVQTHEVREVPDVYGRSMLGWLLTCGGALIILVGVIANLSVYWHSTSLFNTLIIFTLLAGGLGLVARSLKEH